MPTVSNTGRLINLITGIQGVAAGAPALINMLVNEREHRLNFQCTGIAYQPTTTVVPATADAGATFTPQITNGQITGATIVGAVSTKGNGTYALTITDPTGNGQGATGTYTVATLVVTATNITNAGVVSPVDPRVFFTAVTHLVNGSVIRDISPVDIIGIENSCIASGGGIVTTRAFGELPVYFTEPWRKIVNHDTATSWDLKGQNTYSIQAQITTGISSPGLTGTREFDYLRNGIPQRNASGKTTGVTYFLSPIKQHAFSFNVPGGVYPITTLPITYPIQRLFVRSANADISYVELYQDGNKILEGTPTQINQMYDDYGFVPGIYDFMFLSDVDQRLNNALNVTPNGQLQLKITTPGAEAVTVVMESRPPGFY
jgi:hypothetical protein